MMAATAREQAPWTKALRANADPGIGCTRGACRSPNSHALSGGLAAFGPCFPVPACLISNDDRPIAAMYASSM